MQNHHLDEQVYREYLENYIVAYFEPLVDKDIYSLIINRDFQVEIATNKSAQSVGYKSWKSLRRISPLNYDSSAMYRRLFGDRYNKENHDIFVEHCKKIHYLQQLVFEQAKIINFVDMLPYNGELIVFMTSYVPIIHKTGEVIAIHSNSVKSYVPRLPQHVLDSTSVQVNNSIKDQLSLREHEVLFLLTHGANQDKIAQILKVTRSTVSSIIGNQLCPKFNIHGTNTKLLIEKANEDGVLDMPHSFWKPGIIVSNEELLNDSQLFQLNCS